MVIASRYETLRKKKHEMRHHGYMLRYHQNTPQQISQRKIGGYQIFHDPFFYPIVTLYC